LRDFPEKKFLGKFDFKTIIAKTSLCKDSYLGILKEVLQTNVFYILVKISCDLLLKNKHIISIFSTRNN